MTKIISVVYRTSILIGFVTLAGACGAASMEASDEGFIRSEPGPDGCGALRPRLCQDYPEQCAVTQRLNIDVEHECVPSSFVDLLCSARAECVESEWFAVDEATGATFVLRGCRNLLPSGLTVVDDPPEVFTASLSVECDDVFQGIGDDACQGFSPDECPGEMGCFVNEGRRIDPERRCVFGERLSECRAADAIGVDGALFNFSVSPVALSQDPDGVLWFFPDKEPAAAWETVIPPFSLPVPQCGT